MGSLSPPDAEGLIASLRSHIRVLESSVRSRDESIILLQSKLSQTTVEVLKARSPGASSPTSPTRTFDADIQAYETQMAQLQADLKAHSAESQSIQEELKKTFKEEKRVLKEKLKLAMDNARGLMEECQSATVTVGTADQRVQELLLEQTWMAQELLSYKEQVLALNNDLVATKEEAKSQLELNNIGLDEQLTEARDNSERLQKELDVLRQDSSLQESSLKEQIESLKESLSSSQRIVQRLHEDLQVQHLEFHNTTHELQLSQSNVEDLKRNFDEAQEKLKLEFEHERIELEGRILSDQRVAERLEEQLRALMAVASENDKRMAEQQKLVDDLQEETVSYKAKVEELHETSSNLRKEKRQLEAKVLESLSEAGRLKGALVGVLSDKTHASKPLQDEIDALSIKIEQYQQVEAAHTQEKVTLNAELQSLNKELEQTKELLCEANETHALHNQEMMASNTKADELNVKFEQERLELQEQISKAQRLVEDAQEQLESLTAVMEEKDQKLLDGQELIAALQKDIDLYQAKISELDQELVLSRKEQESSTQRALQLAQQLADIEETNPLEAQHQASVTETENLKESLRLVSDALVTKTQDLQTFSEASDDRIHSISHLLAQRELEIKSLQESKSQLARDLEQSRLMLEQLNEAVIQRDKMENEIATEPVNTLDLDNIAQAEMLEQATSERILFEEQSALAKKAVFEIEQDNQELIANQSQLKQEIEPLKEETFRIKFEHEKEVDGLVSELKEALAENVPLAPSSDTIRSLESQIHELQLQVTGLEDQLKNMEKANLDISKELELVKLQSELEDQVQEQVVGTATQPLIIKIQALEKEARQRQSILSSTIERLQDAEKNVEVWFYIMNRELHSHVFLCEQSLQTEKQRYRESLFIQSSKIEELLKVKRDDAETPQSATSISSVIQAYSQPDLNHELAEVPGRRGSIRATSGQLSVKPSMTSLDRLNKPRRLSSGTVTPRLQSYTESQESLIQKLQISVQQYQQEVLDLTEKIQIKEDMNRGLEKAVMEIQEKMTALLHRAVDAEEELEVRSKCFLLKRT